MRPTKASSKNKKANGNAKPRSVAGKGRNPARPRSRNRPHDQQTISHNTIIISLSLIAGLVAVILALSLPLKRPHEFIWNSTSSLPTGFYKRVDKQNVDLKLFRKEPVYITFCLPQTLRDTSFYEGFCSPDAPDKKRILKRLVAEQTSGGWIVVGDSETSLDSRVLGPVEVGQIQGFWRPFWTWGADQ